VADLIGPIPHPLGGKCCYFQIVAAPLYFVKTSKSLLLSKIGG